MKKIWKTFKYVSVISIGLLFMLVITIMTAKFIYTQQIKIKNQSGVQESLYLEIGGAKQYVQIRGNNKNKPLILVLHGGPGSPMSYYSHYWQIELEDDFTIVHWDQRGCGRTYYSNEKLSMEDITPEMLLADLDEIVTYLSDRFVQNDIIILGHSWGTVLGARYTQMHPEKVNTYIAVGQIVNSVKSDFVSAQQAAYLAKVANDEIAAENILVAYDDFISGSDTFAMDKLMTFRALASKYLPSGENMSIREQIWMGATSPHMGIADLKWYLYPMINFANFSNVNLALFKELFDKDGFDLYQYPNEYDVPVYFISGDSDWITPYTMVQDYYEIVEAPKKEMILIEDAGHSPFLDKPTDFCAVVKRVLLY